VSLSDLNNTAKGAVQNLGRLISAVQDAFAPSTATKTIQINTIGTTSVQVLAADATRSIIIFHNPSSTNPLLVAQSVDGLGLPIVPSFATPGGSWYVGPLGKETFQGVVCQTIWNAVGSTNVSTNPLTILTD
jgi:hypothetical protein